MTCTPFILLFPSLISYTPLIQDTEENALPNSEEENNSQDHNATQSDNAKDAERQTDDRIYLDLVPMHSFLHTACGAKASPAPKEAPRVCPIPGERQKDSPCPVKEVGNLIVIALIGPRSKHHKQQMCMGNVHYIHKTRSENSDESQKSLANHNTFIKK